MGDPILGSVLAANSEDQGLVSILITVMIVAVWLIGSLVKARGSVRRQAVGAGQGASLDGLIGKPSEVQDWVQAPIPATPPLGDQAVEVWGEDTEPDTEWIFAGTPETLPYHWDSPMAGRGTPYDLGEPGDESMVGGLDLEQIREALVIHEVLAQPLSMRPMD